MKEITLEFHGITYRNIPPISRFENGTGMCTGCAFFKTPKGSTYRESWDFCIDVASKHCTTGEEMIFVEKESQ